MPNFYDETINFLEEHGKQQEDVLWVCGNNFQVEPRNFWKAANIEYDSGYGSPEIAMDLMLIGADFWMERREYDGSEWWVYRTAPDVKNLPMRPISTVISNCGYETLAECNNYFPK